MIILCVASRSGGGLSLTSGSSLPGRRSAGTDMYLIRCCSPMGVHYLSWEYHPHNSAYHISWHQWFISTTDIQRLHDHFFKALWLSIGRMVSCIAKASLPYTMFQASIFKNSRCVYHGTLCRFESSISLKTALKQWSDSNSGVDYLKFTNLLSTASK